MSDEFTIDELKLAFSFNAVMQIVAADGDLLPPEADFLTARFPTFQLRQSNFITDEGELTQRFHDAAILAKERLPELPVAERITLVRTFFRAALIDRAFHHKEAEVVRRAGAQLGLSGRQIVSVLSTAK
jgi:uncharacterized tellurite resistance protein B-like protein